MSSKEPIIYASFIFGAIVGIVVAIPLIKIVNENVYVREVLGCLLCISPFVLITHFMYKITKVLKGEK